MNGFGCTWVSVGVLEGATMNMQIAEQCFVISHRSPSISDVNVDECVHFRPLFLSLVFEQQPLFNYLLHDCTQTLSVNVKRYRFLVENSRLMNY